MGHFTAAVAAYQQALVLAPDDVNLLGKLAAAQEKLNDLPAAEETICRGLALKHDAIPLLTIQAVVLRRQGQSHQAISNLNQILPRASGDELATLLYELGRCHDLIDEPEQAFRYFTEGNELRSGLYAHIDRTALIREYIDSQIPWLPRLAGLDADEPAPHAAGGPVFIAGFPRSGTTLVNRILDSHPRLRTLEERECMPRLHADIAARPGGFPAAIEHLSPPDKASLRAAYHICALNHISLGPGDILVDKIPLHLLRLPLIQSVFPDSKLVMVLRHPCDVCLSCFMSNFRPNLAMVNFFTLEDTVQLYVRAMDIWLKTRPLLKLSIHVIRYEDLLADFPGEVNRLLNFIGVAWNDRVLAFDRHARQSRGINTPSYHQVCRPLYMDALDRWRRYIPWLEPHLPALRPYIEALGYKE